MGFSDNPNPDYRDTPNHHLHGALGFTLLGGVQSPIALQVRCNA